MAKGQHKKDQLHDELVAANTYITSGFQLQERENDGDDYFIDGENGIAPREGKLVAALLVEGLN